MISISDITRPLNGVLYLACFQVHGFRYIRSDIRSFGQSFFAAGLILPFFIFVGILRFNEQKFDPGLLRYIGLDLSAYAISWLIFPLIMLYLCDILDCRKNYLKFIIAYNWTQVPQGVLYTLLIFLGSIGVLSSFLATTLVFFLLIWTVGFTFFITLNSLAISSMNAIGIVLLDFLLGLVIEVVINSRY